MKKKNFSPQKKHLFHRIRNRRGALVISALFAIALLGFGLWASWHSISTVIAGQQPPVHPLATRVWDGGGGDANWSTCANWDTDTCPVADDTLVFDGSAGGTPNDDSTWDSAFSVSQIASITVSSYSGLLTFTKTPVTITGAFSDTSTNGLTLTGSVAVTIGTNFTLTTSGTVTANTSTVTMTGTSNNYDSSKKITNLTIDPSSTGTITTVNNSPTVAGTLTVAASDTLSIGSGLSVSSGTAGTVTINGTISGAGTLAVLNSNLGTAGTLSAIVKFDATNGNINMPARTSPNGYGSDVEIYSSSGSERSVTMLSGTHDIAGALKLRAEGTQRINLVATNNPTVNVTGDLDYTGVGAGDERINGTGTGTWTISGNVDLTGGNAPVVTSGNTLVMNGTSKTLNAVGTTFYHLTLSGTISCGASGDTTLAGNLTLSGTVTCTRYFRMTGTANLIGGGNSITELQIRGVNITVSLITSDLTVSSFSLGTAADGDTDTLDIASGRTFTTSTSNPMTASDDSITGAGLYVNTNSSGMGATGTLSVDVRQNVTTTAATQVGRTFGGDYECYNSHASTARSCTFGTAGGQTVSIGGNLTLQATSGGDVSVTGSAQNPIVAITGTIDYTGPAGGNDESITTGTGAWSAAGVDLRNGGFTATAGNTFTLTGTANDLYCNGKTFINLTIDPSSTGTVTLQDSNCIVSGTVSVAVDDTLSIASGMILTHTGATLTLNGTISGVGEYDYYSATAFPTSGTISSALYFVADNNDQIVSARTYGGLVGFYNVSSTNRTITLGTANAQTIAISGVFDVWTDGTGTLTVTGATYNPTVTIGGNVTYTGGGGTRSITTGSGTWTVTGHASLSGTFTASAGNTLVMNGTSKTLTSSGNTLQNVTLSGTITLANATHTIAGNFSMAGGTITPGTSTVTMTGTSNTLVGGGATLNNLTIDPSSAGTITLQTSDLTVSSLLTVAAGDTFSLEASRTITLSGNSGTTLTLTGTISGAGRLTYQNSATTFPTAGTLSSIVRFDVVNGNLTMPNRTYGGAVEAFNGTSTSRNVTPSAGTHTLSGNLLLLANGTGNTTLVGATNNPTVNLTGDLDFTGTGSGTEIITSGTGTWTASDDVDFSGGTYTATAGNTLTMNGTGGKTINAGSNTLDNFTVDPSSTATITFQTGDGTVSGTLAVASGDTLSIEAGRTLTHSGSTVTLTGTIGGNGTLVYQSSSSFPTTGTINADLRFDATNNNQTMGARTYGGDVELYNNSSSSNRTVTPASGSIAFAEDLTLNAANTQNVTFDASTNNPTIAVAALLDFIGIGSGNKSIESGTGTWTASGDADFSGGDFIGTSGNTFVMDGTSKTLTAPNDIFSNLTIAGTITVGSSSLDINNTFTLSSGSFTAPTGTMTVAGNFTHTSGTFTANGGTVTLDGTDQTIAGTTTFANLTKTVSAARTLTFPANATQTITGTLTLEGASGALLSLRSSTTDTQWRFDPQSTRSIQYLDVKDSNNVNQTAIQTVGRSITDSGNNTGWSFGPNAPTGLAGSALSSTRITWTWTDNSTNETGFRLKDSSGATVATIDANTATVTETGLTKETPYTRTIVAYNTSGESTASNQVTVTTNANAPSVPTLQSPETGVYLSTLTPAFRFGRSTDDDDGIASYTLYFDRSAAGEIAITVTNVAENETATLHDAMIIGATDDITATLTSSDVLEEGSHSWTVQAIDAGANVSEATPIPFTLDITKPTVGSVDVTGKKKPIVSAHIEDTIGLARARILLEKRQFLLGEEIGRTTVDERTETLSGTSETVSHEYGTLSAGSYRVTVTAEDRAGNESAGTANFSVSRSSTVTPETPPTDGGTETPGEETGGKTPAEEREEEIDNGGSVSLVPEDLTLPNLEKFAKERRELEATNFQKFLARFIPESFLERLNRAVLNFNDSLVDGVRSFAQNTGTFIAHAFGITTRQLASLRSLLADNQGNLNRPAVEQLEGLDTGLAALFGRAIEGWRTAKDETLGWLVRGRKNRSALASENEHRLEALLAPVRRVVRWVGVGARVAYHGIRGDFEELLQISDVAIVGITPDDATVTWKTNRPTTGKVNWGDSISYGEETSVDGFDVNHRVILMPLVSGKKYYFEILATDTDGKQTYDAYYGFTAK